MSMGRYSNHCVDKNNNCLSFFGSLSYETINDVIESLLTKKRMETGYDIGLPHNNKTGRILNPYTPEELAKKISVMSNNQLDVSWLYEPHYQHKIPAYIYSVIAKRLSLVLAALVCQTFFLGQRHPDQNKK